jgi:hypothetical protein
MRIISNKGVYFNRPLFCTKLFVVQSDCPSVFVLRKVTILHPTIIRFKCALFQICYGLNRKRKIALVPQCKQ